MQAPGVILCDVLAGSWVVISRAISPLLITPLTTTHEPPSRGPGAWQRLRARLEAFLLCAPSGYLLLKWFCSVEWVLSPGILFDGDVLLSPAEGWIVLLNLAGWVDSVRPVGCSGVKVKSLWVHETQYPQLALHRQAFKWFALFVSFVNVLGISRTFHP